MYVWLCIILFLAVIEAATVNLTTIWFILSGLVSMMLALVTDSFMIQFAVFVILGIVLLITTRSFLQSKLNQIKTRTNADRVIGMHGVVTEEITKKKYGEVKVDGKLWTALADKKIKVNTTVEILEIDGVKLKVKEIEED